ncbi:MAG: class I SAM-dependent methyltransferase [Gammaproteobacteria bacterium]|nr:class I SAM-dependent methyltransferase [Gammaproteobacteria bacterium]HXK55008.1 class I SAM-dependent methyltransferase [Gammaproteobacteria bacterium]
MNFDRSWEEIYKAGRFQRYPWDSVVSFVFRYAPRDVPRESVRILEVGCGAAANLWFAAREGFSVTGLEGSKSAISYAKQRFKEDGLTGDLHVGDFTQLPYDNEIFDLVIDRGALTCVNDSAMNSAISEIYRVMKPNAVFHFNPYADSHSGLLEGVARSDGLTEIPVGAKSANPGLINFVSRKRLDQLFGPVQWEIISIQRREDTEMSNQMQQIHAEWLLLARKRIS